jgi:hypothetical protein
VIAKSVLQVKADAKSKATNTANPVLTYTVSGFVNGDSSSLVSGAPTLSTTATQSSPAGDYPITVTAGSLSAANYSFTFTGATLTVFVPPVDTDHDGIPNSSDPDDDNDGIPDAKDGYPLEADGALSGVISQQIAANPSLRAALAPIRAVLLALGL